MAQLGASRNNVTLKGNQHYLTNPALAAVKRDQVDTQRIKTIMKTIDTGPSTSPMSHKRGAVKPKINLATTSSKAVLSSN